MRGGHQPHAPPSPALVADEAHADEREEEEGAGGWEETGHGSPQTEDEANVQYTLAIAAAAAKPWKQELQTPFDFNPLTNQKYK